MECPGVAKPNHGDRFPRNAYETGFVGEVATGKFAERAPGGRRLKRSALKLGRRDTARGRGWRAGFIKRIVLS